MKSLDFLEVLTLTRAFSIESEICTSTYSPGLSEIYVEVLKLVGCMTLCFVFLNTWLISRCSRGV